MFIKKGTAFLVTTDLAEMLYEKSLIYHLPPFSIWFEVFSI